MVERGTFRLHSFLTPPVTAGHYQLRGTIPIPELPVDERVDEVIVSAPRFTMPPDKILSTFPPAMADGDFGGRLPQIVLKRRTLPWGRDTDRPARAATDPPHADPHTGETVSAPVKYLACLVNLEGQVGVLPTDAQLATQDHFDIFGAVQDLRFTAAAAPSTDHVVMGTGQLVDLAAAGSPHA